MTELSDLRTGEIVWAQLDPVVGREQAGHRPVVVVSSAGHLRSVTSLAVVVPLTTRRRGWLNHVPVSGDTGLVAQSFAMTEQPRTVTRSRITRRSGSVDPATLSSIRRWLGDFLGLTRF